jgi:hypothetical protein
MEESKVHKEKPFNYPFKFDADIFNHAVAIFKRAKLEYKITVHLSDGSRWDNASESELLGFINLGTRRILRVIISSAYLKEQRISIKFESDRSAEFLSYEVDGSDEFVTSTSRSIEELFSLSRQWYWPFMPLHPALEGVISAILFLGFFVIIGVVSNVADSDEGLIDGLLARKRIFYLVIIWAILLAIYLTRTFFFPIGSFLIGDGKTRETRVIALRKRVYITMLGGIILEGIRSAYWPAIKAFFALGT